MSEGFTSLLYGGVDINVEGEGGPICLNYLSPTQRIIETIVFCFFAIILIKKSYKNIKLPMKSRYPPSLSSRQQVLLSLHMLVFGVELGFKFASRSLIWIFNPCHVLTIIQSFLLFLHPSPILTAVYRIHIHMMNGPILAILFPITGQRFLPLETATYYFQHFNILFIPPMLIKPESPFSVEPLTDFSWALFSLGLQTLYHFLVLQPIGLLTGINMNNMICPGVSDPFASPYYRIFAMIHQPLMVLTVGKLFSTMFIAFKKSRLLRAELNPPRVTAEFPDPPYGKDWHLISYNCQAVTESTTSPFTSKRFNKFYYSAIPISMTKVEETPVCEATLDELFLNQNILFVPIEGEINKNFHSDNTVKKEE